MRFTGQRSKRRETLKLRICFYFGAMFLALVLSKSAHFAPIQQGTSVAPSQSTRTLLSEDVPSDKNISSCEVVEEESPMWNSLEDTFGKVPLAAILIVFILYTFLGLAIICDDFFVSSLEFISAALNLSDDVAGATFMAAGSSAPELFTAVADAFLVQRNVGSGTIAGSAVFNLVVIPGCSAAIGGKVLDLDWRPMLRDAGFYLLSIVEFALFSFSGNQVEWWEAAIMLLTYFAYIVVMKYNTRILHRLCPKPYDEQTDDGEAGTVHLKSDMPRRLSVTKMIHRLSQEGLEESRHSGTELQPHSDSATAAASHTSESTENAIPEENRGGGEGEEEEEEENPWKMPTGTKSQILWILSLPYMVLFTFTVPNCQKERFAKWYPITFIMSVVWIGLLTGVMVKFATKGGDLVGIDPSLMGIVLLAAGTSVPDTIASVIVAKQGKGDMAVSNAVGSNVFDILLGLGLPWLLATLYFDAPISTIECGSDGLGAVAFAIIQLVVILIVAGALIVYNKFRLSPRLGYVLFGIYVLYVIVNVGKELVAKSEAA